MSERFCVGVDLASRDLAGIEHDSLVTLYQMGIWAEVATHIIGGFYVASAALPDRQTANRVAAAFNQRGMSAATDEATGDPNVRANVAVDRSRQAARLHRNKVGGRVVRFVGDVTLDATVTVTQLLAGTPIDGVIALGGKVRPEDEIVIDGFARPTYAEGKLILHVTPLADGRYRTFEIANPHQCCGGLH